MSASARPLKRPAAQTRLRSPLLTRRWRPLLDALPLNGPSSAQASALFLAYCMRAASDGVASSDPACRLTPAALSPPPPPPSRLACGAGRYGAPIVVRIGPDGTAQAIHPRLRMLPCVVAVPAHRRAGGRKPCAASRPSCRAAAPSMPALAQPAARPSPGQGRARAGQEAPPSRPQTLP